MGETRFWSKRKTARAAKQALTESRSIIGTRNDGVAFKRQDGAMVNTNVWEIAAMNPPRFQESFVDSGEDDLHMTMI